MSHMVERIVPVDPIRAALGVGSGFVTLSLSGSGFVRQRFRQAAVSSGSGFVRQRFRQAAVSSGSGFVTLSLSQSMAIRGHPSGNPRPSEAIRGNPRPSEAIRGHRTRTENHSKSR